jgi:hypothetical protein
MELLDNAGNQEGGPLSGLFFTADAVGLAPPALHPRFAGIPLPPNPGRGVYWGDAVLHFAGDTLTGSRAFGERPLRSIPASRVFYPPIRAEGCIGGDAVLHLPPQ